MPLATTPFIGREGELEQLNELLADQDVRLVTIVGPGGMGKTRLALAAAEKQLNEDNGRGSQCRNGVFFVGLEALESSEQIPAAVSRVLDFRPSADDPLDRSPWQQTVDHLRPKRLLLILDNLEQLLDGAHMLAQLYHTAPGVRVLATSRERLELHGERLFPLGGLHYPGETLAGVESTQLVDRYAAIRLFVQSVRRARPDFRVAADQVNELVEICRLVGGMPLALEMAAGWADLMSLQDIVRELSESLDLLETGIRDVPERQRSMTAVFNGTWQRLQPAEQDLLQELSVFRGGFTREAARQVAEASLRQLADLCGKSLIQFASGADRYNIHRLLRQFLAIHLARDKGAELHRALTATG